MTQELINDLANQVAVRFGCPTAQEPPRITVHHVIFFGKKLEYEVVTFRLHTHESQPATHAFAFRFPPIQKKRNEPGEFIAFLADSHTPSAKAALCQYLAEIDPLF